ncbi:MAG: SRPBCC family protein [Alphaproteobacteria bacterium]
MELKGLYSLPAPPDEVWAALSNPQVLLACLPGLERAERISDHEFKGAIAFRLGTGRARLAGHVRFADVQAPYFCLVSADGHGVAGFAKGRAKLRLTPSDGGTTLSYDAEANVSGRLAQAGPRVLEATARRIADEFFAKLDAVLGGAHAAVHDPTSMIPASHTGHELHAAAADPLGPQMWVAGLVSVVVILLVLFGMVL